MNELLHVSETEQFISIPVNKYTELVRADYQLSVIRDSLFKDAALWYDNTELRLDPENISAVASVLFPVQFNAVMKQLQQDRKEE